MDKNLQIIYDSANTIIYKGKYENFIDEVIVKVVKSELASQAHIERLDNEYILTKKLQIQGVRNALERTKFNNKEALILEYVSGDSIRHIIKKEIFHAPFFLQIAIKISNSLGEIHLQNIIHKDINSNNILLNLKTQNPTIIDFGLSSKTQYKTQNLGNPDKLEGTLLYISPEQTGRMNRIVDYRTDLYSLGIVFYEMLTGQVPFRSEDSLEVIHAHIARKPKPPHTINPNIPEAISKIVLKLLEKNAENRYQSAFGLKYDLKYILNNINNIDQITNFDTGKSDFSGKLIISEKIYGRKNELDILQNSFKNVCAGDMEFVTVAGNAGTGKSVLIKELHK